MLLAYNELVRLVEEGVIKNSSVEHVNGSSIDIHLGDRLLVECDPLRWQSKTVNLFEKETLAFEEIFCTDGYVLDNGGPFILGHSIEIFNLPANISAEFKLKSGIARTGLEHLAAGWADATWHNSTLTLELFNVTKYHKLRIKAGMKIGQMTFFQHSPVPEEHCYAKRGQYNNDLSVQSSKGIR